MCSRVRIASVHSDSTYFHRQRNVLQGILIQGIRVDVHLHFAFINVAEYHCNSSKLLTHDA